MDTICGKSSTDARRIVVAVTERRFCASFDEVLLKALECSFDFL
jgi:hypothetical protein